MKIPFSWWLIALCPCALFAQQAVDEPAPPPVHEAIDKRVAGVLPNYRTADGTIPFEPITAKQKMTIAAKDSFDYPVYFLSGFFSGIGQLTNQNPGFGQGLKGFGHRFITGYADQSIGNLLAEGTVPALLHEDPRYFRIGPAGGSGGHRLRYALTRIFVTKTDRNTLRFNFSEILGNAGATAISNAYLPDQRNAMDNTQKFLTAIGTDAISNVIKEFWPDVKHRMQARKAAKLAAKSAVRP
jgi:hypothetical protein